MAIFRPGHVGSGPHLNQTELIMGHGDQNLNLPGGLNFAPDEARVTELEAMMLSSTWHLGKPCEDRDSWETVRKSEAGERLMTEAREFAAEDPLSVITNTRTVST